MIRKSKVVSLDFVWDVYSQSRSGGGVAGGVAEVGPNRIQFKL